MAVTSLATSGRVVSSRTKFGGQVLGERKAVGLGLKHWPQPPKGAPVLVASARADQRRMVVERSRQRCRHYKPEQRSNAEDPGAMQPGGTFHGRFSLCGSQTVSASSARVATAA